MRSDLKMELNASAAAIARNSYAVIKSHDLGLLETFGIGHGSILHSAVAVMYEIR